MAVVSLTSLPATYYFIFAFQVPVPVTGKAKPSFHMMAAYRYEKTLYL